MHRRQLLGRALGLAAAPLTSTLVGRVPAHAATLGKPQPFDFAALKGEMRAMAQAPYEPPRAELPDGLAHLDYDAFQSIAFDRARDCGRATASTFNCNSFIELVSARPQFESKRYRAMFGLAVLDESPDPIDLRMYVRIGTEPLTETWMYQWIPPPSAEREKLWRPPTK